MGSSSLIEDNKIVDTSSYALRIRQKVLRMAVRANGGHIAPANSIADIVAQLYFGNILKYNANEPRWNERDYLILSKGHGVLALYAALSMAGMFDESILDEFCCIDGRIGSLALEGSVPGIEASCGSLGHGLSYAVGVALAKKLSKEKNSVYVILGDGECQEGSVWEGLMASVHHKLDNLVVIIDNNRLQAMDSIDEIMSFGDFKDKLSAFGFSVEEIDGHNQEQIKCALEKRITDIPRAIVAHTVKGKGISFMEDKPIWHYRVPNEEELKIALKELEMKREDLGSYERSVFRNII